MATLSFGCIASFVFAFVSLGRVAGLPLSAAPSFLEVGNCAPFVLMEDFESQKYLGTWYTISSVPNSYIPVKKCMKDVITMKDDGMEVLTMGFGDDDSQQSSQALLTRVNPLNPFLEPYLQLQANLVPPVPYHIVETNYTSYSCVYSCFNLLGVRAELFFILSRTPTISDEARQKCLELFEDNDVNTKKLVEMEQSECHREDEEEEVKEEVQVRKGQEEEEREEEASLQVTEFPTQDDNTDMPLGGNLLVKYEDNAAPTKHSQGDLETHESQGPAGGQDEELISLPSNCDTPKDSKGSVSETETLVEDAEELIRELEGDVAMAVEVVENSMLNLMKDESKVVATANSGNAVDQKKPEDIEGYLGSSSPPVSLPTTILPFLLAVIAVFFSR